VPALDLAGRLAGVGRPPPAVAVADAQPGASAMIWFRARASPRVDVRAPVWRG
jgi:hypothetical protein